MGDFLSKGSRSFANHKPTQKSIIHPFLGEFPIFQNSETGEVVLYKKIDINRLDNESKNVLRTHLSLSHPSIIKFEGYEQQARQNEYSIFFENFDCTLKQEIQRRAATNTRFTEKELISFLRCISSALAYLQGGRLVHGQIRTETIVKSGSSYKVLNMNIFGDYKSTYHQALEEMRKTQIRLLSPQLQEALFNKIVDPVHEGYKDDVYALGVVVLDAMTLDTDSGIPASEKLARATKIYSKSLISLVNKMLENIMSLRLDCIACNTIIENIYVQKDVIPQGLYSSRVLTRDSFISYRTSEQKKPMSTGVSLVDLKKYSPSYKQEQTLNEQHFSPSRENRSRIFSNDLNEPSINNTDYLPSFRGKRDYSQTGSILAKSFALPNSTFQTPEPNFLGRYDQSNSKLQAQNTVSNFNPIQTLSPIPTYQTENDKRSYNVSINATPQTSHLAGRNLSSVITNDPLICSIIAQSKTQNRPSYQSVSPYDHKRTISTRINPEIENIKISENYSQSYSTKPSIASSHVTSSVSQSTNYMKNYDLQTPPKQAYGNHNPRYEAQKGDSAGYKPVLTLLPLSTESNYGCSQPMQIDNSPIYSGYSQIEQNEKEVQHSARRNASSLSYSVNLNSSRLNF